MRVFVYEYCCAVGLGRDPSDPAHSLYREGRAMRDAVADDFHRVPGAEVVVLDGDTARRERERFREAATGCDWCLVIAPELGGELQRRAEWARKAGARLLGPSADAIAITSCKIDLARIWDAGGVPTPRTEQFLDWFREPSRFPVVCKPISGAGSTATVRFDRMDEVMAVHEAGEFEGFGETELLLQEFTPGQPASVAFLVGPVQTVPLPPTFQLLSSGDRFRYEGGELPIRPDLAERAIALGQRAVGCVPGLLGFVGVDLILGDAVDGSADVAIEINSRLTTSYVGLRQLADFNLAEAMLRVAAGEPVGELRWRPGRVRFRPDGSADCDRTPDAVFG